MRARERVIRANRPARVCDRAVMLLTARSYDPKFDRLYDLSGNGLHARLGSSVGADTNDPLRLQYAGEKHVYFPGLSGNNITVPDNALISVAGDLELRALISLDSWASGSNQGVLAKWGGGAGSRSYRLQVNGDGTLGFFFSNDGTTTNQKNSTSATGLSAFSWKWIRAVLDVNNGAGGYDVLFYLSDDGVTWTKLGNTVTTAGTTSVFDSTQNLEAGAYSGGGLYMTGRMKYAQVLNGIAGTQVANFDSTALSEPYSTYTDQAGNVWTFNRSTSGRKLAVVDRDMFLLGTDDYFEVADSPLLNFSLADSFTIALAGRRYASTVTNQQIVAKQSSSGGVNAGFILYLADANASNLSFGIADGSVFRESKQSSPAVGVARLLAGVRNRAFGVASYVGGTRSTPTSDTTTVSISNSLPLQIGARGGSNSWDGEFFSAAIFREALSESDLVRLAGEWGVS